MFNEFNYKVQIIEAHLDTFGHVNNAVYMQLYEQARWDFITSNGFGLKEVQSHKKGPVILESNITYRRELKNRETITIKSKTTDLKGKIMKITQSMIKEDGTIASEAIYTIGFMDLKERKLINPPDLWLKAIGKNES